MPEPLRESKLEISSENTSEGNEQLRNIFEQMHKRIAAMNKEMKEMENDTKEISSYFEYNRSNI